MIEHHAAETYPHECCGALYGEAAGGVFTVVEAVALPQHDRRKARAAAS